MRGLMIALAALFVVSVSLPLASAKADETVVIKKKHHHHHHHRHHDVIIKQDH
jgi:hypothetical protein